MITETALAQLNKLYKFLLLELDEDNKIVHVNGDIAQTGYKNEELIGNHISKLFASEAYFIRRSKDDESVSPLSTTLINAQGKPIQIEIVFLENENSNSKYAISYIAKPEVGISGSEIKLKALFDSALDGVITINEKGIIESLNPATTKLFGYEPEELLNKNVSILMPEPDHSRHDGYIEAYIKTGNRKIIGIGREVKAKKKDGTLFPMKLSITEIVVGDNRTFMGMIHDLTNQKIAEKKIKKYSSELEGIVKKRTQEILKTNESLEKEIRERKIIESALLDEQKLHSEIARNFPDGTISVLDKDLNYLFIDGKELFELGLSSKNLTGSNIKNRLPTKIASKMIEILDRVFQNRKETMEIEMNKQSYMVTAVPITGIKGNVDRILVVEENITKQKNAERKIKNALKKEMELNSLKDKFVSMASHEFRTPLSTVLSSVTLIERYLGEKMDHKTAKHVERIKSSVFNLTEILNDMLSLSKLEEGVVRTKIQEINFKDLCLEIHENMQQQSKPGQNIDYKHEGDQDTFHTDPFILKNVLHNLISNAIKYSPENSTIRFNSSIDNDRLIFSVNDEGMGIPEIDQPFLFQRFFRAGNVNNTEGTGLGLSIVKRYVDLLNGTINFKSEVGKGSYFEIEIQKK